MSDIFVSYTSEDRNRVRPIVEAFQQQGWSVWWDRKIPIGETWDQMIENAIGAAKCVVVVWSKESVKSTWVRIEANHALHRGILVPAMIDDAEIPLAFSLVQTAKLVGWQGDIQHPEFANLLRAVAKHTGQSRAAGQDRAALPRETEQDEFLIAGIEQLLGDSKTESPSGPSSESTEEDFLRQLDELLD